MNVDVTSNLPCFLTGSHQAEIVSSRDRHGNPLRTVICRDSGLVYTDPRPEVEEIKKFYAEDYRKNYKGVETPRPRHVLRAGRLARMRLDEINRFLPPGASLLDVGSGGGEFVYTCQAKGMDAHGIEPNQGYANFSIEEYGIDVACRFYDEARYQPETFDCITMFHVLEHLVDPVGSILHLAEYLKTGGRFVIEVPNVDYTETAPHQKWHVGHLFNFNLQTLEATGMKAGLEPTYTFYSGVGSSLFAVFTKPDRPTQVSLERLLKGSYEATSEILRRHTTFSHFLNVPVPVRRCVSRWYRSFSERKSLGKMQQPRQILDALNVGELV